MKVIVSDKLRQSYNDCVIVKSFKELEDRKSLNDITCVIIHSIDINPFEIGVEVSKLRKRGIKNFAYINSVIIPEIEAFIKSMNGIISDDEYYLQDEESLDYLLDAGLNTTDVLHLGEVEKDSIILISNFVTAFAKGDEAVNSEYYLNSVKEAINTLSNRIDSKTIKLQKVGEGLIGLFHEASTLIDALSDQRVKLQENLEKANQQVVARSINKSGRLHFFQPYNYIGNTQVLLIKEYSPCRYLTSFIIEYMEYLEQVKKMKMVKLLFVYPNNEYRAKKYNDYTNIELSTVLRDKSLLRNQILATAVPVVELLAEVTRIRNLDMLIVVDRLDQDPIIRGSKVITVNAVSGHSDIERYKLQERNTILPIMGTARCLLTIPHIPKYPVNVDTRRAYYQRVCKQAYEKLDRLLNM